MAKIKRMNNLMGLLKDKVSLVKATLLLAPRRTTSLRVAVLRATTHAPSDPPPAYIVDDVLTLGHHHRPTAGALVHALLRRVHQTSSAYVSLKCLLTLHHIISRGSPVLNDQIASFTVPYDDGSHLLNLSTFKDQSDADTWELSSWVRWYAALLDHKISTSSRKSLITLVNMVERISDAPDSLHYQRISLVYEIMKLVGEDYRVIMREINTKVKDISTRIMELNDHSLDMFLSDIKRIEKCRDKLFLMFLNKMKNDGVWELIENVRINCQREKVRRENMMLLKFQGNESSRVRASESKALAVMPPPRVKRWLDVDWNPLVVSTTA